VGLEEVLRNPAKETWGQFHQHSMSSFCTFRSRKRKKTDNWTVFFALLESECAKAARRMLMKSTLGVNFIIVLQAAFVPVDPKSIKRY